MAKRSLTGLLVGIFAVAAALVVAVFVVLLLSVNGLKEDSDGARRSSDVLIQSFAAQDSLIDLETGVRGYLLTGQKSFLDPYTRAKDALPGQMRTLLSLTRNPSEVREVLGIAGGAESYVATYADNLVAQAPRMSQAQKISAAGIGKQLIDNIRTRFNALDNLEVSLRMQERNAANTGATLSVVAAIVGVAGAILLLVGFGTYLLLRVLRPVRIVSAAAESLAAGELDARAPAGGRGEVEALGHSFNAMATVIQAREADLTEARTELEQALVSAEQASGMKSDFLSMMSHEIRTPLNGVVGMLTLLSDTGLTPEQREYIDVARSSGDALMTVVNDILDISKIEAGRLEIEQRDFDLCDMVEASCDMVAASAVAKGIALQSFVRDDVPRAVCGDRMRVSQILVNLLSNAVKFTHEGDVVAEVSLVGRSEDGFRVRFEVRDTGIGIPPDRLERLFEAFVQADTGTTREFGGTGLGLAISRELTELMGGMIGAESEPGQGSTFRFELPFAPSRLPLAVPVPSESLRGLRVLIVDDHESNRQIFKAYVASWGMRPVTANDAADALARLRQAAAAGTPFDVALLDQNLPGQTGVELAATISGSSVLSSTRLILLSSSGLGAGYGAAGFVHQLTKPVRQSRLLEAISTALATKDLSAGAPAAPMRVDAGLAVAAAAGDGVAIDGAAASQSPPAGARILVAEDQDANRMLIDRLLSKRGHTVEHATNGQEVLEMLAHDRYDLVLMDCQMPLLDGYDTTREIRRREDRGEHSLIVAMTANAMIGDRERCIAAGMDDYIPKPIDPEKLDEILIQWLPDTVPPGEVRLERSRLDELRALFPGDEMSGMLRMLESEIVADLERIGSAIEDDNREEAAAAAHRIRNSARLLGAMELADAAAVLDTPKGAQQNPAPAAARVALEALLAQWDATRSAIEAELAQA